MRPPQSRHERRKLENALRDNHRNLRRSGLPVPTPSQQLLSLSLLAKDCVERRGGPDLTDLFAVFDIGQQQAQQAAPIACHKGCNFCCHIPVSATIVELDAVVRHVTATWSPVAIEALKVRIEATYAAFPDGRAASPAPCPFLVDGSCSVYSVRPLSCRRQVSIDASIRERALHRHDEPFPFIRPVILHGRGVRVAFAAALQACGIDAAAFELTGAVRRLLAMTVDTRRFDRTRDFGDEVLSEDIAADMRKDIDAVAQFVR